MDVDGSLSFAAASGGSLSFATGSFVFCCLATCQEDSVEEVDPVYEAQPFKNAILWNLVPSVLTSTKQLMCGSDASHAQVTHETHACAV